MENDFLLTMPELSGLVIMAFGFLITALAIHRKRLRENIKGLNKIVATDRASFTRKTEKLMQGIGLCMLICGLLTLIFSALISHTQAV